MPSAGRAANGHRSQHSEKKRAALSRNPLFLIAKFVVAGRNQKKRSIYMIYRKLHARYFAQYPHPYPHEPVACIGWYGSEWDAFQNFDIPTNG
jgi:hypothetical protein